MNASDSLVAKDSGGECRDRFFQIIDEQPAAEETLNRGIVVKTLLDSLTDRNVRCIDGQIQVANNWYTYTLPIPNNAYRSLDMYFRPRGDRSTTEYPRSSYEVNRFGQIRVLQLYCPNEILSLLSEAFNQIKRMLQKRYEELESDFLTAYEQLVGQGLTTVYNVLNQIIRYNPKLIQSQKDFLSTNSWLAITNVKTGIFLYLLPIDALRRAINQFVQEQDIEFSPFTLARYLICSSPEDSFWTERNALHIASRSDLATLPFVKLTAQESNFAQWTAEGIMFQDPGISAAQVCLPHDYCVMVVCPERFQSQMNAVLPDLVPSLTEKMSNDEKFIHFVETFWHKVTPGKLEESAFIQTQQASLPNGTTPKSRFQILKDRVNEVSGKVNQT